MAIRTMAKKRIDDELVEIALRATANVKADPALDLTPPEAEVPREPRGASFLRTIEPDPGRFPPRRTPR